LDCPDPWVLQDNLASKDQQDLWDLQVHLGHRALLALREVQVLLGLLEVSEIPEHRARQVTQDHRVIPAVSVDPVDLDRLEIPDLRDLLELQECRVQLDSPELLEVLVQLVRRVLQGLQEQRVIPAHPVHRAQWDSLVLRVL